MVVGLQYEMSTLVPPQFDEYGTTFWIPSQVEPSVALIGSALPALRPLIQRATQRVTTVFSTAGTSTTRSRDASGNKSHRPGIKTPERSLLQSKGGTYIELNESVHAQSIGKNST